MARHHRILPSDANDPSTPHCALPLRHIAACTAQGLLLPSYRKRYHRAFAFVSLFSKFQASNSRPALLLAFQPSVASFRSVLRGADRAEFRVCLRSTLLRNAMSLLLVLPAWAASRTWFSEAVLLSFPPFCLCCLCRRHRRGSGHRRMSGRLLLHQLLAVQLALVLLLAAAVSADTIIVLEQGDRVVYNDTAAVVRPQRALLMHNRMWVLGGVVLNGSPAHRHLWYSLSPPGFHSWPCRTFSMYTQPSPCQTAPTPPSL